MKNTRLIDLSMTLREGMMSFPVHWHPLYEMTQMGRFEVEGRETRKVILGTHTGTHIDAPRHFIKNGNTVEFIPLEKFYGPATILDFSNLEDKSEITVDMLKAKLGGSVPERLLLRYDWDRRLDSLEYYSHHPFISEDACVYLVDGGLQLLGTDAPMPDNPQNGRGSQRDSPNHTILLGAGVVILEYLTNLKEIPPESEFIISALPLKIESGDGAPVRAIAIVQE